MSDAASPAGEQRPRPQYGEYATPDEQRARIRQPLPEPVPPVAPAPAAPPTTGRPGRQAGAVAPGRLFDRAAAVALLVYGLLSLTSAIPALLDPTPLLAAMGLDAGDLGVTTTGGWGIASAVLLVGGWLLTAWLTWLAHRRGWIVFWIPLAGGIVFNGLAGVLVAVGLLGDPGVFDAILRQNGG
ncbi:DUF6264 family protein [Microbacterium marinilacus]|uniref:Integral membrane protein n=1 Tax=Microbacterium marinilacus TaxID=415209 RepID=A0ABP7B716_9MICO|nr:DUF6264 family protein [Microbacterium marinilacus]MBY0687436.1 DUF6264 family protein [Microbacterium marinilacus]